MASVGEVCTAIQQVTAAAKAYQQAHNDPVGVALSDAIAALTAAFWRMTETPNHQAQLLAINDLSVPAPLPNLP